MSSRPTRERFDLGDELDLENASFALTERPADERDRKRKPRVRKPRARREKKEPRTKRRPRPSRPSEPAASDLEILDELLRWPTVFALAEEIDASLPVRRGSGRRRDPFPTFMFVIFVIMKSQTRSQRATHALFRSKIVWQMMQDVLIAAWPYHDARRLPGKPITRHHFIRWRKRYFVETGEDDRGTRREKAARREALRGAFTRLSVPQALAMGFFKEGRGTLSKPDLRDLVAGDATNLRSLFKHTKGDMQWNRQTKKLEQIRFDPDATVVWIEDEERYARGTGWIDWQTRTPEHENERLTLWFSDTRQGEANAAVEGLVALRALIRTGWYHYVYDMAWRGVHCDAAYNLDLMPIVKVVRDKNNKPKSALVHLLETQRPDGQHVQHPIFALDGAPVIVGMVNGREHAIKLIPRKPRRDRDHPTKAGHVRWYGEYKIPDHPGLPLYLRGIEVRLRLDGNRDGISISDNLRFHNEHTANFPALHGLRQDTESDNNRLKQTLWNKRAHSVGYASQTLDMLGFYLLGNLKAAIAYRQRTGRDPCQTTGVAGPADEILAA